MATERKWVILPLLSFTAHVLVLEWMLHSISQQINLFCPAVAKGTVAVGEIAACAYSLAEQQEDPNNASPPPLQKLNLCLEAL